MGEKNTATVSPRGYRAGIDVREQAKTNVFYQDMIAKRAEITGEEVGLRRR